MNNSGDVAIPDWQQRVMQEHVELEFRLQRLRQFCRSEAFWALPYDERDRLQRQEDAMAKYAQVLGERIAAFVKEAA